MKKIVASELDYTAQDLIDAIEAVDEILFYMQDMYFDTTNVGYLYKVSDHINAARNIAYKFRDREG